LFGKDAGPTDLHGERLFEDISVLAAESYFGGTSAGRARAFGFPRRVLPAEFSDALDTLCGALGEGVASNRKAPRRNDQKDAMLDLVAWRDFPDARVGKAIGFGQCATGRNGWEKKASELVPDDFQKLWMTKATVVNPLRMFFVPWRVEGDDWERVCIRGGILFERCRIAHHASVPPSTSGSGEAAHLGSLRAECQRWCEAVTTTLKDLARAGSRAA
jgi:hypothetical protein